MTDQSPRPPMPRGAAGAVAAAAALVLLAGLLVTTNLASNVARVVRFDDAIGALRSASFDLGALGAQPLLRAEYVTSVVGDAFGSPGRERTRLAAAPRDTAEPPAPSTTTTTTRRPLVGRLLARDARLAARMVADRETVAPGEQITYTVVLTNTGTSTISGTIEIQSHVPVGTFDARRQCDSDTGINLDPEHLCVSAALVPAPGTGEQTHQVVISSSGRLPPGEEREVTFSVRVADVVPPGSEISNHAHADLLGDGEEAVSTEPVVVVVS